MSEENIKFLLESKKILNDKLMKERIEKLEKRMCPNPLKLNDEFNKLKKELSELKKTMDKILFDGDLIWKEIAELKDRFDNEIPTELDFSTIQGDITQLGKELKINIETIKDKVNDNEGFIANDKIEIAELKEQVDMVNNRIQIFIDHDGDKSVVNRDTLSGVDTDSAESQPSSIGSVLEHAFKRIEENKKPSEQDCGCKVLVNMICVECGKKHLTPREKEPPEAGSTSHTEIRHCQDYTEGGGCAWFGGKCIDRECRHKKEKEPPEVAGSARQTEKIKWTGDWYDDMKLNWLEQFKHIFHETHRLVEKSDLKNYYEDLWFLINWIQDNAISQLSVWKERYEEVKKRADDMKKYQPGDE